MIESQEYYLLQVKILKDGDWYSVRNSQGNIIVFMNPDDAVRYSQTESFEQLNMYPIKVRILREQVVKQSNGGHF